MGYNADERETVLVFNDKEKIWDVYSTVGKHIRKLLELGDMEVLESEDDRPIAVKGKLTEKQISMRKVRTMSEEQRLAIGERLKNARENNL
jgi:hypothetical protein